MTENVTSLYETNFRDPVATLRKIADEIEAGKYGDVSCVAISLMGDQLQVFGAGPEAEGASIGMVLHAGFSIVSRHYETHGR